MHRKPSIEVEDYEAEVKRDVIQVMAHSLAQGAPLEDQECPLMVRHSFKKEEIPKWYIFYNITFISCHFPKMIYKWYFPKNDIMQKTSKCHCKLKWYHNDFIMISLQIWMIPAKGISLWKKI